MTKQAGFKRRVRARMAKTGESYATARSRLSREYPATRDGLSLTERRVLAAIADGAPDAGTAFVRARARETRPWRWDDGTETIVHLPDMT
jgi:hypothetical protein